MIHRSLLLLAVLISADLLPRAALGQSFEVLHSWQVDTFHPTTALCRGSDGNFYGTTDASYGLDGAPAEGAVFRLTAQGQRTVIHAFFGFAQNPRGGLVRGTDGFLYGTTYGEAISAGTIFKLGLDGSFEQLVDLQATGAFEPHGGLIQSSDGHLYGTTEWGGASGVGTIFRVTTAGQFTVLSHLGGQTGSQPRGRLIEGPDGNLYGTTSRGGANDRGTIFKLNGNGFLAVLHSFASSELGHAPSGLTRGPDGHFYGWTTTGCFRVTAQGAFTELHTFATAAGQEPRGDLILASDGHLYGTTTRGAAHDLGGVFRLSATGAFSQVHDFDAATAPGEFASVIEGEPGVLYGTVRGGPGPESRGAVFRLTTAGALTVLSDFQEPAGGHPSGPLVEGGAGRVFGTTTEEGRSGSVFRVDADGALTTLGRFTAAEPPGLVKGGVVVGADGLLYGLSDGAAASAGIAFSMAQSGASPTVLKNFTASADGAPPRGQMLQAADGNFYGVTTAGGASGFGTVFRLAPSGEFTTVSHFGGTVGGKSPNPALALGADGRIYGTCATGGTTDRGTLFRITPGASPAFSSVLDFTGANGANPTGVLVAAPDGFLYGTTLNGGTGNHGTVFRVTAAGQHSIVAYLGSANAARPRGALAVGPGGDLYGVVSERGTGGVGGVYRVTPAGALTLLHSFNATGPRIPMGGLVLAADGRFFGTTTAGGSGRTGTIFSIDSTGVVAHLRHFDGSTGDTPLGALFRASSGALYGVNRRGGSGGAGTVYRLSSAPLMTLGASQIRAATAILHGAVNPEGRATAVRFEYSTDPSFQTGVAATPEVDVGNGGTSVPVSAAITGLTQGTVYYLRLVARTGAGTHAASSVSFTTNSPPTGGLILVFWSWPDSSSTGGSYGVVIYPYSDPDSPVTYQAFLDGHFLRSLAPFFPSQTAFGANFGPLPPAGRHTVTIRVLDGLGDYFDYDTILHIPGPTVRPASLAVAGGQSATIAVAKLLLYAQGEGVQFDSVRTPSAEGGRVELRDGIITYTARPGFFGTDTFTYTVRDAQGYTAVGTVSVAVTVGSPSSINLVSIAPTAAGFLLRFAGIPGYAYVIQFRDSLHDPWQTLVPTGPIAAGPTGLIEFEDRPNPRPPARFYRAAAP